MSLQTVAFALAVTFVVGVAAGVAWSRKLPPMRRSEASSTMRRAVFEARALVDDLYMWHRAIFALPPKRFRELPEELPETVPQPQLARILRRTFAEARSLVDELQAWHLDVRNKPKPPRS